jgi:hypothetical protein
MRTLTFFVVSILVFLLFFAGCIVQIVSVQPSSPVSAPSTLQLISLAILGVYEVVVRAVPSVGNYSIVSWLITALKFVSDKLNNSK